MDAYRRRVQRRMGCYRALDSGVGVDSARNHYFGSTVTDRIADAIDRLAAAIEKLATVQNEALGGGFIPIQWHYDAATDKWTEIKE
jgi:hypothetical protein